ncbi:MAG: hypothetical protein QOF66_2470 [Mycobacterium sp.]|nr:hypothetical protein [Mycobacterium sp.]MDT5054104.1 hypothetical protein [Mycobacterium sp.]MDT5232793.1 hypothetical protein [Mycobacterium sp.]
MFGSKRRLPEEGKPTVSDCLLNLIAASAPGTAIHDKTCLRHSGNDVIAKQEGRTGSRRVWGELGDENAVAANGLCQRLVLGWEYPPDARAKNGYSHPAGVQRTSMCMRINTGGQSRDDSHTSSR